jgi:hypothetical protein
MAGCMDSEATNYNADANVDDGSCVYFELEYFTDLPVETGESSLIIIQNANLEAGDEVGLFDMNGVLESVDAGETPEYGELLVGAGVWTGDQLEIVGVESVDLSQFGGPVLNGYVSGNSIVYKVYKASEGVVYNADVTYEAGDGNWGAILTVISYLDPVFSVTQDIELNPYTFNMMSLSVTPETDELAEVFADINLLLIKNDGSDYYVPSYNVDQIGTFDNRDGYKVFLNGGGQQYMSATGLPVGDMSIDLHPYMMNIMPYFPDACMATSDVFSGYEGQILIVKNDESDYYVPSYNVETLSEMCPGEGYAIFLNGSDGIDFTYPMGAASYTTDMIDDYKMRTRTDAVTQTGLSPSST